MTPVECWVYFYGVSLRPLRPLRSLSVTPRASRMTWLWGLLAAIALLWPDRVASPFDGVPLDRVVEVVFVGAGRIGGQYLLRARP